MDHYRWILLTLSALLNLVFVFPYTYEIVKGAVRPNRVSWFLWLLLGIVSLLAVLKAGGRQEAVFNFFFVLGEGVVFLLALFKGETKFGRVEAIALSGGLLAFGCLVVLRDPRWTLFAVIVTDLFGFIPTWVKAWRDPASESLMTYTITFWACLFGYLAVLDSSLIFYLYPFYLMLGNGVLVAILFMRRRQAATPQLS